VAFQLAIRLRSDQHVQVGRALLCGVMEFVEVAFPILDDDPLGLGHAPSRPGGLLKGVHPANALFLIERFGVAPGRRLRSLRPRPAVRLQQAQRHAIGSKGQQAV
jgi:hypothetical protein